MTLYQVIPVIERLVDDFGFRYPGVGTVEHVYFYAVGAVDAATRREYLQHAYQLGHEFDERVPGASESARTAA